MNRKTSKLSLIFLLSVHLALGNAPFAIAGSYRAPTSQDVRADSKLYVTFSKREFGSLFTAHVTSPELIIERGHENDVFERLNNVTGYQQVVLESEKIIVRSPLRIPGAYVEIRARQLVFDNAQALIDTTPEPWRTAANGYGSPGARGSDAGSIVLKVGQIVGLGRNVRFRMNGGKGQDPGPGRVGQRGYPNGIRETKFKCDFKYIYCHNKTGYTDTAVRRYTIKDKSKWPGNGTNATAAGRPGTGGNAGNFSTSVIVSSYNVQQLAGPPGRYNGRFYGGGPPASPHFAMKIKWKGGYLGHWEAHLVKVYRPQWGRLARQTFRGIPGRAGSRSRNFVDWYTPQISAVSWQYIDDLYFSGNLQEAATEAQKHLKYINLRKARFTKAERGEALAIAGKLNRVFTQIRMMKDYYGNPMAWAPPLSLEGYLHLYKQETKQAIKQLYLAKRLLSANVKKEAKIKSTEELQELLREEIESKSEEHSEALKELPSLQKEFDELQAQSADFEHQVEVMTEELKELAKKRVEDRHKLPWWKKGLKILGGLAMCFPVGQPFVGLAGAAAVGVASFDEDNALESFTEIAGNMSEVIQKAEQDSEGDPTDIDLPDLSTEPSGKSDTEKLSESIDRLAEGLGVKRDPVKTPVYVSALDGMSGSLKEQLAKIMEVRSDERANKGIRNRFMETVGELDKETSLAKNIITTLLENIEKKEVPGLEANSLLEEVEEEFKKLSEENPKFLMLTFNAKVLLKKKGKFDAKLKELLLSLQEASSTIVSNLAQIAELSAGINGIYENRLTPGAHLVAKQMQSRAEHSLRKYHYYLQKAYSYRFLEKYSGQADLRPVFNRMERLITTPGEVASREDFDDLHSLYHAEISNILKDLLDDLDAGDEEHEETIRVHLTKDELSQLQLGTVPFNLLDRSCKGTLPTSIAAPCIDESYEDVRITKVQVSAFKLVADSPLPPHFHLYVEHSGLSKFWRFGKMHLFRLYDDSTQGRKSWRNTLYDNGEIRLHRSSQSQDSLIRAFLSDVADFSTFVRPSAWGDLKLRLKSPTSKVPILSRVTLLVSYTYRDQRDGTLSWREHFESQNKQIRNIYRDVLDRNPTKIELSSKRALLDLGYSMERIKKRIRELAVPGN